MSQTPKSDNSSWVGPKKRFLGLFKTREFLITPRGPAYMRRHIIVQNKWFAIYIHDLLTADVTPDPHTHPWSFVTLVVRGGYDEQLTNPQGNKYDRSHPLGSFKRLERHQAHWLKTVRPKTRTLLIAGPVHKDWGFVTANGFVHWSDYIGKRGGPMPEMERG